MRTIVICAVLSSVSLSGCYDYALGARNAMATANEHCESEGKQFVPSAPPKGTPNISQSW